MTPRVDEHVVILRLITEDPVPGVLYSLQDARNQPVDPVRAGEGPLTLEVPVTVRAGRLTGPFVRREGPVRRFVYIAIAGQAGDQSCWSRRAKIDVHDIPADMFAAQVLECRLPGRARDGGPACATVRPIGGWRVVE